jgi:hypothetical protein
MLMRLRRIAGAVILVSIGGIAAALALWGISALFDACVAIYQVTVAADQSDTASGASFLGDIFKSLFPWPFVVLVCVFIFVSSSSAMSAVFGLMRSFQRISILGAEIVVSDESKKQIKAAAEDLNKLIKGYREDVDQRIKFQVRQFDLEQRLGRIITELKPHLRDRKLPANFRCTMHLIDSVVAGNLYQLLDYYPSGGGAGRRFSERYGIIGKVWRSGDPMCLGDIGNSVAGEDDEAEIKEIIKDWGMTHAEAAKAMEKKSVACAAISFEGRRLGVIYMDSSTPEAFPKEISVPGASGSAQLSQVSFTDFVVRALRRESVDRDLADLAKQIEASAVGIEST